LKNGLFHNFLGDVVLNQKLVASPGPLKAPVKAWALAYYYPDVDLLNTAHHSGAIDEVVFNE